MYTTTSQKSLGKATYLKYSALLAIFSLFNRSAFFQNVAVDRNSHIRSIFVGSFSILIASPRGSSSNLLLSTFMRKYRSASIPVAPIVGGWIVYVSFLPSSVLRVKSYGFCTYAFTALRVGSAAMNSNILEYLRILLSMFFYVKGEAANATPFSTMTDLFSRSLFY